MNDPIVRRARENRRRQHPIDAYVVGFACPAIHLVIEVDGPSHDQTDERAVNEMRERYHNEHGWRVLRIKNVEVFQGAHDVEDAIWRFLEPED
jgi:very-short-patch-repair endonuclease